MTKVGKGLLAGDMMLACGMNLLICGQGYLGKALGQLASDAGHRVVGTTLHGGDGSLACDLGCEESVRNLRDIVGSCTAVVHCASSGKGGAEAYERVYLGGMKHVAKFFPEAKLLFTSSTSVYAQVDGSWVTEDSPAIPDRETGRFLLEAEQVALGAGGIVCRLAGIYGPNRSVILKKFLTGEAVIEEDGRRYMNQIHRDDAAAAILHVLVRGESGVFNVSDNLPISQRDCYEGLAIMFGRPMPPVGERDLQRKRGWTHKRVSNERLRLSGWKPRYATFLDAVADGAETLTTI
jgi:nucleoside-diphosphate-sugar epimerase